MTRTDILKARLLALAQCFMLIADVFICAVLSIFTSIWAVATKQEGAAPCFTETLSARAGRALLNRKWWRWLAHVIDWLWSRQSHVAELPKGLTFTHRSHCIRAFIKTREGAYLPREYHGPLPPSIEAGYGNTPTPTP